MVVHVVFKGCALLIMDLSRLAERRMWIREWTGGCCWCLWRYMGSSWSLLTCENSQVLCRSEVSRHMKVQWFLCDSFPQLFFLVMRRYFGKLYTALLRGSFAKMAVTDGWPLHSKWRMMTTLRIKLHLDWCSVVWKQKSRKYQISTHSFQFQWFLFSFLYFLNEQNLTRTPEVKVVVQSLKHSSNLKTYTP